MSCCDCYKLRIRDSTWKLAQKIWQRSESFQRYKESMKPLDCNCRTKESSKNFLGSLSFALGILLARSSKTDCIASTVVSGTLSMYFCTSTSYDSASAAGFAVRKYLPITLRVKFLSRLARAIASVCAVT